MSLPHQIKRHFIIILGTCLVVLGLGILATFQFLIPVLERHPVKLQLETFSQVDIGQPISLKLHVHNTSNRTVEVRLAGDPAHKFIITRSDGSIVWESRSGLILVTITKQIPAGDEIVFTMEWDQESQIGQSISPGRYQIQGILHFTDPDYQLHTPKQWIDIR